MTRPPWHQFTLRALMCVVAIAAVCVFLSLKVGPIWDQWSGWPRRIRALSIENVSGESITRAQVMQPDGTVLLNAGHLIHNGGFGQGWSLDEQLVGSKAIVSWIDAKDERHVETVRWPKFENDALLNITIGPKGTLEVDVKASDELPYPPAQSTIPLGTAAP